MLNTLRLVLALTVAVSVSACAMTNAQPTSTALPAADEDAIVFSDDVLPVLQDRFAPLLAQEEGLSLDSWETLMDGSDHGAVVIPFDPDGSLLLRLATELPEDHALRPAADRISDEEIALVRQWIEQGARNDAGEAPFGDAGPLLYTTNQGAATVSVIDMTRNQVIRTVNLQALGFGPQAKPHHVAVEPDGSHWYLSLIGENRVLKFNRDNELVGQVAFEVPGMLALDAASDRLLVGRSMSAVNPPTRIGIVERGAMRVEEIDVFYPRPHALAVGPAGTVAYSASLAENRLAAVDTEAEAAELLSLGGDTQTFVQFAIAPSGDEMVAGGQVSGQLLFFDLSDPMAPQVTDTLAVPAMPWHPLYTPDGRYIYFGSKGANAVTVVDAEQRKVAAVIEAPGIAEPHGSAIRPDGRYVYISNNNRKGTYTPRYPFGEPAETGTVTVIDTATNEVVQVIEVGTYPTGLGAPTPAGS